VQCRKNAIKVRSGKASKNCYRAQIGAVAG
jgi:hypothetical protein